MEDLKAASEQAVLNPTDRFYTILLCMVSCVVLLHIGLFNFTMLHILLEIVAITMSLSIAAISYSTYKLSNNFGLGLLGITYAFVGILNIFHLMAFDVTNVFPSNSSNLSTQFAVLSKYLESLSILAIFLVGFRFKKRLLSPLVTIFIYATVILGIWILLLHTSIFPVCMTPAGPTPFKIANEYIITGVWAAVLWVFIRNRQSFHPETFAYLLIALASRLLSQIPPTLCPSQIPLVNILGQVFRFVSYFFMFKTIIETNMRSPIKFLFYELHKTNQELTEKTSELVNTNQKLKKEILERRRIEQTLIQSEQNHRQIFEFLPDGVAVLSRGKFLFANNTFARLMGVDSPAQLMGKNRKDFVRLDPLSPKSSASQRKVFLEDMHPAPLAEYRLVRHDNVLLDVEIMTTPFPSIDSKALLVVVRDISPRKKMEALQKNMEEKNRQLKEALELDRLKTEFFANISHELRTPLNVILGSLQLVHMYLNEDSQPNPQSLHKHSQIMRQNCLRLLRIINNLIDSTKIDAGFFEPHMGNYNIVSIVEDITLSVADYTRGKSIYLQFDTDTEEKFLACDPDMIERIVLNLLSNSIKFTDPGDSIMVNVWDKGDSVQISVKDTGIGIPYEKQQIIFERFRQADALLTRKREGSGIGLSLVKSLVELHGGSISVQSEPGEGSEFIIELPAKQLEVENLGLEGTLYTKSQQDPIERIKVEFSDIYM